MEAPCKVGTWLILNTPGSCMFDKIISSLLFSFESSVETCFDYIRFSSIG